MVSPLITDKHARHVAQYRERQNYTTSLGRRLRFSRALAGFVLIGMLLTAVSVITFVKDQHEAYRADALERAVGVRLDGVQLDFARALDTDWSDLSALAGSIPGLSPEMQRVAFDATVGAGARVSWIGFTGVDGIVLSASGGLLEGESVAERPWFQNGLDQNYAGDVHDAVLLNNLLNTPEGDPLRFIDFSRPVKGANGTIMGVIGMHVNFDWAQKFIAGSAASLGLDVFLLNQAGEVIQSSDGKDYGRLDLASIGKATAGVRGAQLETWPDGRTYFTSVIPKISYADLPSFGWRMVGRIDPAEFSIAERNLMGNATKFVALLGFGLLAMTFLFCRIFVTPLEKLANSAARIAQGADEYPFEANETVELKQISTALAVLQGRSRTS